MGSERFWLRFPLGLCLVCAGALPAAGRVRQFSYSRESALPRPATAEFQFWTTDRAGRPGRFQQFDNRLELEVGLTDSLMTAFYLNSTAQVSGTGAATQQSSGVTGVSSEWKLHLSGPSAAPGERADGIGTALFGEITYGPFAGDARLKLIVDGRDGAWLWAGNLTVDQAVEDLGGADRQRSTGEVSGGVSYGWGGLSAGLELWSFAVRNEDEFEGLTVYSGPTLVFAHQQFWLSATLLLQLGTALGSEGGFSQDLVRRERLNARILVGRGF